MKQEYIETPTEADFPLIDRCVVCNCVCAWQPRYERFMRLQTDQELLDTRRPLSYVPEHRVVKICSDCAPNEPEALKAMIRLHYPVYAQEKGI